MLPSIPSDARKKQKPVFGSKSGQPATQESHGVWVHARHSDALFGQFRSAYISDNGHRADSLLTKE